MFEFLRDTGGDYYFIVQDGDSMIDVLRAIVMASFEVTSTHFGRGFLEQNPEQRLSKEEVDSFIWLNDPNVVIAMNEVNGKKCYTWVYRTEVPLLFRLDGKLYEKHRRGKAFMMFLRAKEILKSSSNTSDK